MFLEDFSRSLPLFNFSPKLWGEMTLCHLGPLDKDRETRKLETSKIRHIIPLLHDYVWLVEETAS